MKRLIPLAVLFLALLAIGLRLSVFAPPAREPAPEAPNRGAGEPGVLPPEVMPGDGGPASAAGETKGTDDAGSAGTSVAGTGTMQPPPSGETPTAGETDPGTGKPAVRRNPRDPPAPDPRVGPGGKRPPFGPTGQWEKFPPEIPRGRASLKM